MKKKIISLLFVILLLFSGAVNSLAVEIPKERQKPLLVDEAGLLNAAEKAELLNKLEAKSRELECEIAVVTVSSLDGKGVRDYADDYYDYNGYGYGDKDSGILFLISIKDREWAVSSYGLAKKVIKGGRLDKITDETEFYLRSGGYFKAFNVFADGCIDRLEAHRKNPLGSIPLISVIAGIVLGFFAVTVMKGKLKSVKSRSNAGDYVVDGSLNMRESRDIYLYRTISKVAKPKESSSGGTHTSSSGRSHGGSSGRF